VKRVLIVTGCLVVGLALGLGGALALGEDTASTTAPPPLPTSPPTTATPAATVPPTTAPTTTAPPAQPVDDVLLAWTAGGLPSGFADGVAGLGPVEDVTVVRGDLLGLVATHDAGGRQVDHTAAGWRLPFDVLAVDPGSFGRFVDGPARRTLRRLGPGQAVLGETSAELRGIGEGGTLTLDGGQTLTVVGVAADDAVAGAEAVVDLGTGASLGVDVDRYLLARHRGPRPPLDAGIRSLTSVNVQIRSQGETPFLRHADAVLPQALIKARFGEFAYQGTSGPLTIDPAWVDRNIVHVDLPVLGSTTCHRSLVPALRGALEDLVAANLEHLVASFEGCYNPRTISGSVQLSRHAWGAAVDVNFSVHPTGTSTAQDPRLVDVFARWGFGSGDAWLIPDSGHFEYIAAPSPGAA
jgi:hypothetical protein